MHPNSAFQWNDEAAMRDFVCARGFGMLFAVTPDGPHVAHLPIVWLDKERIGFHLARGNGMAAYLDGATALLVINGPDSYISPDWYGMADQVPTWNYLAVEVQGLIRRMEREELASQVDAISTEQERRLRPKRQWSRGKMAEGLFDRMLEGIVGFEMRVTEMRGTAKLGQNKPAAARVATARELDAVGRSDMAGLMRRFEK